MWASLVKRRLCEGPGPLPEDSLLGSAYLPLIDLLDKEIIGGSLPLFKAEVDSLGGQSLHVEIQRMDLSNEATPTQPADYLAQQDSCIEVLVGG